MKMSFFFPFACGATAALLFASLASFVFPVARVRGRAEAVPCLEQHPVFHGITNDVPYEGGPEGSCWCGKRDKYCLCTPSLSVDVVIGAWSASDAAHDVGVVVARRSVPPFGVSLLGGYVEVGESVEAAAEREVLEESGLNISGGGLVQLHFYSDPRRDPRRAGGTLLMGRVFAREGPVLADLGREGDETFDIQITSVKDCLDGKVRFAFSDHLDMVKRFHAELGRALPLPPPQEKT